MSENQYIVYVDPGGDDSGMVCKAVAYDKVDAGNQVASLLRDYVRVEVLEVSLSDYEAARDAWVGDASLEVDPYCPICGVPLDPSETCEPCLRELRCDS